MLAHFRILLFAQCTHADGGELSEGCEGEGSPRHTCTPFHFMTISNDAAMANIADIALFRNHILVLHFWITRPFTLQSSAGKKLFATTARNGRPLCAATSRFSASNSATDFFFVTAATEIDK